ncbi:hypothetical protein DVH24_030848 [Malus domestica]|uniref:Phospholipase A1 n=1 Tax=Malus domestica TaxID=3750 RepID=A0A498HGD2_MALDO|nr:hypothetical protein DVH24_030848 [Malus domestica]
MGRSGREFAQKVKRSVAWVNKSSDFLKDQCHVPESWWVENNKGWCLMRTAESGCWLRRQMRTYQ